MTTTKERGMRGIQYLVDESGATTGVVIDLHRHGDLWEDFYDFAVAEARQDEPVESLEDVKKRVLGPQEDG